MKPCRKYRFAFSLFVLTIALPCRSATVPLPTSHFRSMGLVANAVFDTFDATGCIDTFAAVFAVNGQAHSVPPGSPPTTDLMAFVTLSQFNFCPTQVNVCPPIALLSAFGSVNLPPGAFVIEKNLSSATLNTSIEVFDSVSNTSFPVAISLSWTGTGGPPTLTSNHFIMKSPGVLFRDDSSGLARAATVSGGVNALGMNFAAIPVAFVDLESDKDANVAVIHQ